MGGAPRAGVDDAWLYSRVRSRKSVWSALGLERVPRTPGHGEEKRESAPPPPHALWADGVTLRARIRGPAGVLDPVWLLQPPALPGALPDSPAAGSGEGSQWVRGPRGRTSRSHPVSVSRSR